MARVTAANTRRFRTGHIYPLPSAIHKCPICRASLHFDIEYPGPLSGEGAQSNFDTSSLIQPLSLMNTADSSLVSQQRTAVAQSALSATSIGAENIRSAIGARVLVALAVRQRQPEIAMVRANLRTVRGGSLEIPVTLRVASPALLRNPPIASPIIHGPWINRTAGQSSARAASDAVPGVIEVPPLTEGRHPHTGTSSNAGRSIGLRDAQLHEALDHWFPPMIHEDVEEHPYLRSDINPRPLPVTNSSFREAASDQSHAPPARSSSDLQQPLEEASERHLFVRAQQGRKRKRAVVRESNLRADLTTPVRRSRRLLAEPPPKGGEGRSAANPRADVPNRMRLEYSRVVSRQN